MLIPNVGAPHICSLFVKSLQQTSLSTNMCHFPRKVGLLGFEMLWVGDLCIRFLRLKRGKTQPDQRLRSAWRSGHVGLLGGHTVEGAMLPPIWPPREGRNPMSSHLATRNRGAKPIFWVWFDWEGSVFLAAMLRKVPACNNLRISRKEIQEY